MIQVAIKIKMIEGRGTQKEKFIDLSTMPVYDADFSCPVAEGRIYRFQADFPNVK